MKQIGNILRNVQGDTRIFFVSHEISDKYFIDGHFIIVHVVILFSLVWQRNKIKLHFHSGVLLAQLEQYQSNQKRNQSIFVISVHACIYQYSSVNLFHINSSFIMCVFSVLNWMNNLFCSFIQTINQLWDFCPKKQTFMVKHFQPNVGNHN